MFHKTVYDLVPRGRSGFFSGLGVAFGCGALLYNLRRPIKSDTIEHTANVACETLNDHKLRMQAVVLSTEVVNKLLKNDDLALLLRDLVVRVLNQNETKNALMMLVHSVFDDPYFQETVKKFVIRTLINDPWIVEKTLELSTNTASGLLRNPDLQKQLTETFKKTCLETLESEKVQDAAVSNGRTIAKRIFSIWS